MYKISHRQIVLGTDNVISALRSALTAALFVQSAFPACGLMRFSVRVNIVKYPLLTCFVVPCPVYPPYPTHRGAEHPRLLARRARTAHGALYDLSSTKTSTICRIVLFYLNSVRHGGPPSTLGRFGRNVRSGGAGAYSA